MVKRAHWLYLGWVLFMAGMVMKSPPWEGGWMNVLIGLGMGLGIPALSHAVERLERNLDVGEARFDSETGKQLPPYRDEK